MSATPPKTLRSINFDAVARRLTQKILPALAAMVVPSAAFSEPTCTIFSGPSYPEFISIDADQQGVVQSTVTFVLPHTGFVLEWSDLEVTDRGFSIALDQEELDSGWTVLMECSNTYTLGPLEDGAYVFEVFDFAGDLIEATRFFIVDGKPQRPPVPADVSLASRSLANGVEIEAQVRFLDRGFTIFDWGDPVVDGQSITIEAEGVRQTESDFRMWRSRHTYTVSDLEDGQYSVRFLLNGYEMANDVVTVNGHSSEDTVRLFSETITDHQTAGHTLQVEFRHPEGIDTDSFDHRDLRVTGPENFERHARFIEWAPVNDAAWPNGVVATYEIDPPRGFWTADENGRYAVFLEKRAVKTGDGVWLPERRIGEFEVRLEHPVRPLVRVKSIDLVPESSLETTEYGVELTLVIAHTGVQVRSWGSPEWRDGLFVLELDVEADEAGFQMSREESHFYELGALPVRVFDFVVYASNVRIGSERFAVTDSYPIRVLAPEGRVVRQSSRPAPFTLYYISMDPIDLESVRLTSVEISGPGGYRAVVPLDEVVSSQEVNGEYRLGVRYSAPTPNGVWRSDDNGYYRVSVPDKGIRDEAGRFLAGGVWTGFLVDIPPPADPTDRPVVTVNRTIIDDVAFADVTFDPRNSGMRISEWPARLRVSGTEFIAFVEIDEEAEGAETQAHRFRLGKLPPGYYTFRLEGSNGFVSRNTLRISNQPPVRPIDAWRAAAGEAANVPAAERPERFSLREYAFGPDGEDDSRGSILTAETVTTPDGVTRLIARYPENFSASDLNYRIEISEDLRDWVDATGLVETIQAVNHVDGRTWCTVELKEPATHGARFVRVRAVLRE